MSINKGTKAKGYKGAFKDDEDLVCFLRMASRFEQKVMDLMETSDDFTLRMEVRGNRFGLVHCRVSEDEFDRPPKSDARVAAAKKPKS